MLYGGHVVVGLMDFWTVAVCLVVSVNTLFAVLSWSKSGDTHSLVNSRMDEFKDALSKAHLVSMEEFRKALMNEVVGVMRGPVGRPGMKGEKGDKGDPCPHGKKHT